MNTFFAYYLNNTNIKMTNQVKKTPVKRVENKPKQYYFGFGRFGFF
jgi:hypothetical protein